MPAGQGRGADPDVGAPGRRTGDPAHTASPATAPRRSGRQSASGTGRDANTPHVRRTLGGKFSFTWLYLSVHVCSKDRAGFSGCTRHASAQGVPADLARAHLPRGRLPPQTAVTARPTQRFRNADGTRTWLKLVSCSGSTNEFTSDVVIVRYGNTIQKEDKTKDFKL